MRIAILGATGLLGRALVPAFAGHECRGYGSADIDIRDASQIRSALEGFHPDWTILAAAYTDVDGAEKNPEAVLAINREGACNVARATRDCGSHLLFLSTDYVFDGSQRTPYETDDSRCPINLYGRSKAEAEEQIQKILPDACIVRTSWLFGLGRQCFPDTILRKAAEGRSLRVVDDQRGSPTLTDDLARAIVQLAEQRACGIVHVTNQGECSWYEFAEALVADAGLHTQITPVGTAEFVRPARRPAYSVLSGHSRNAFGISMASWQDAAKRYVAARAQLDRAES